MPRRTPGSRRSERGASAVEFALVMPILFGLIFGIIQYGLYFWGMQGGSDIARGAARLASVGSASTCDAFEDDVLGDVAAFGGATSAGTVTRTFAKAEGNAESDVEIGDRVTVELNFSAIDMDLLPLPHDGNVVETVEARVDYVPTQPETCP